jgi:NADPH-dependent 2,4-dienoyl-CoA reductase/sulfur reductase-like enzyme/peroxiredoxin family protein/rhodanese-related sulfurtransferase/TusA-related sulfurtransferase
MSKKVVIVGGVAGGATAAARLRRIDEKAQIIMFEKGEYISFANCGLPYYVGGAIETREALLLQTPEAMNTRFNMDTRINSEVMEIDRENKKVKVKKVNTGEVYEESYDELILSPGSLPLKPPIPGIDAPNIFTLWNVPDVDKIKRFVEEKKVQTAIVIGGGFIGVEMAENFHDLKIKVSLVEALDQVMAPIDFEMAQIVHAHMKNKKVDLYLADGVKSFEYKNGKTTVTLNSGTQVTADIVMLSIGVRPQTELAKACGLELGPRGHIIVDDMMKTSDPHIWAIGDAIEIVDFMTKQKSAIPLAGPANKQGRIVANNILMDAKEEYKGTQGTSIAKVFDLTVAATGINEKNLKRIGKEYGKDYFKLMMHPKDHAGYYPGAIPMTIKAIFDKDGKVLGAQIVGYEGVDKRIDVIATAIRFNSTIYDLKELELAYAPPYSSAKDPVNMIGFTAENILNGFVPFIHWDELDSLDDNTVILDVRDVLERELGYIMGSINIPVDELRDRLSELDKSKRYVTYCAIGVRGYIGARILKLNGFENVLNLSGGYSTYATTVCQNNPDMCGGIYTNEEMHYDEHGNLEDTDVHELHGDEVELNACGLSCPGPIVQVYAKMNELKKGDVLYVRATDPGFMNDIATWSDKTGNTLIDSGKNGKEFFAKIRKGKKAPVNATTVQAPVKDNKTIVVFSDDLDKAIATFVIANGAAAMGKDVTLFFTFWGLNILKKENYSSNKEGFVNKMFSAMMPKGPSKLRLSKLNFFGMGPVMVKGIMKKNNISALEEMIDQAVKSGVKLIACNMSMDLLGITNDELIDGVEHGGVASYLGAAEDSNVNLFI